MKSNIVNATMMKVVPVAKYVAAAAVIQTSVANATVISGNSDAYALGVDINVAGELLTVDVTAPSGVSGSAPAPYNINNSVLGAEVDLGAGVTVGNLLDVQAAALADETLLGATASSNVDGGMGARMTSATATVNDLSLDVVNTTFLSVITDTAVNLSSSTIYSEASVAGDYGDFDAMGSSYIEDLSINLFGLGELDLASLGLEVDADGFIAASPNFEVLDVSGIAGLNLILNEQYGSCNDMFCSMGVNALRLSFNAVDLSGLGLNLSGLLDGDIVIGHSYAEMSAQINEVPAPATLGIFGLVMLALGFTKRRAG